ncbi:MAG: hypothetical protein ACI4U3_04725 [Traorella sp.]
MKKWVLICLLALLCGCQVNSQDIKKELTNSLNEWAKSEPISYTTMEKPLYSYYLPRDIGRISSNSLSSLLIKDNVKFIMNFNPNGVVIHNYYHKTQVNEYEEIVTENGYNLYYNGKGTFLGSDYRYHDYSCKIKKLDQDDYLIYLDMEYVNYSAVVKEVQIPSLIHSMFVISKSIQYNVSEVVSQYSLKSTSESIKQDLEEFNNELPNDGSLSDLIDQSK